MKNDTLLIGLLLGGFLIDCQQPKVKDPTIEFIRVRGGTYEMGDVFGDGDTDEKPTQKVKVSDFFLSQTEVTVAQFRLFVDMTGYQTTAEKQGWAWAWTEKGLDRINGADWRNPGFPQDDNHPVVNISWNDAVAFCEWQGCRLPTEKEWEYAARGKGKNVRYAWGNDPPEGRSGGNVADLSAKKYFKNLAIFPGYDDGYIFTAPVGTFAANELGVFDMTGNVWEWCENQYEESYTPIPERQAHIGYRTPLSKVLRGGSWNDNPDYCRCFERAGHEPEIYFYFIGFRVARSAKPVYLVQKGK